jgi:hypothetical protein
MTEEKNEIELIKPKESSMFPIGEEAKMISQWAKYVSNSPYYQKMGGDAAIVSIWLIAREIGMPPMTALNGGIYYVQGKIMISSQGMNALIRKKGHSIQKIVSTKELCQLKGRRKDTGDISESVFTIQQAQKAGLTGKDIWQKYPERMLFNRALSNLAKDLFPDIIGGCDIASDIEDAEVEIIQPAPAQEELSASEKEFMENLGVNEIAYLEEISTATQKSRDEVIRQAAKDPEQFKKSYEMYQVKNAG